MSEHPIDPEDEVRPCPNIICEIAGPYDDCELCNGTGRLGNPEAEKVLKTFQVTRADGVTEWRCADMRYGPVDRILESGATEAEALAAAREALGREV